MAALDTPMIRVIAYQPAATDGVKAAGALNLFFRELLS
jgi:hypothetical protein